MIVMAIDPGTTESAWVLYDSSTRTVMAHAKQPNEEVRLVLLGGVIDAGSTLAPVMPEHLVIEMIESYGQRVGFEVFETCVWIGRFIEAWGLSDDIHTMLRRDVKRHICCTAAAKDADVRRVLLDRFPKGTKREPGPGYGLKADVWQALALGITFAETHNTERRA